MRTRYMLQNLFVNIGGQLLITCLTLLSRILFLRYLDVAYLGVNGLFSDVLTMLSLIELGIGTALLVSMYRPAAEGNQPQLIRLMNLYRRLYRLVALIVLLVGLALLPFLHLILQDSGDIPHLSLIYLLYLVSTAASYLFSWQNSIYLAHQRGYVRMFWQHLCEIMRILVQMLILVRTQNFFLYLMAQLLIPFFPHLVIAFRLRRDYPYLQDTHSLPSRAEQRSLLKSIGSMSLHRLSGAVVRTTNSLILSSFIGLETFGLYSNYRMILDCLSTLVNRFFGAFTSGVGHLNATESPSHVYRVYRELELLLFFVFAYLGGGLAGMLTPLVRLLFGESYCLSVGTLAMIVLEFYVSGMRRMNLLFREVCGLFNRDRLKALVEPLLNLLFSLLLVGRFGVGGVLGGAMLSMALACLWVEPYILMRYGIREAWQDRLRQYFRTFLLRFGLFAAVSVLAFLAVERCGVESFGALILCGVGYTVCFALLMGLLYHRREEFRSLVWRCLHIRKAARHAEPPSAES